MKFPTFNCRIWSLFRPKEKPTQCGKRTAGKRINYMAAEKKVSAWGVTAH